MPMPTIVAVGAAANGTANVVPALPAGWMLDDILLIFAENQETTAGLPADPTGYLRVGTGSVTVTTGTVTRLTCWWKRATLSESAPTIIDPGDHVVAQMIAIRGCVTNGNPWNQMTSATETVSDTSVSIPGVTTTADDCLILAAFSTGQDVASTTNATGWTNASLANLTERMDVWVIAGGGGGFAMATGEKATAGAVSATTATVGTANFKALLMIALRGEANLGWGELPIGTKRSQPAVHGAATW